ncbi:hypothetical protein BIV57_16075 [Mangrovactinospora gilvigrisea]|uniref:PucR family transcriptional regulator n=1 Tax=Mangrovactinospora gilvigrisea TaxID=1428644 RepID=A0A1J7CA08_9ACTN|nr:PucR family transcriptional regulator ligand-binding domain-containing protein [Mangrovactinospora gilvigrisea]OIV36482.1 hypothetical protein BIV57_16075 [Mangrovactinospora gilvigrisea]
MRIRELLRTEELGLRLLHGEEELDRRILRVMVTDLNSPRRFLAGGELVLSGLLWHHGPEDSERFVSQLAEAGAAALAAGEAEIDAVPEDLVAACRRFRMPLLAVPEHIAFGAIAEHVGRLVSAQRAADLAEVLDRHRALMAAPDGAGLDPVLELLAGQLDLRCRVLTPTGRQLAAAGPAQDEDAARGLARARLRAGGHPRPRLRDPRDPGGEARTAFPVGAVPAPGWASLHGWFLLADGDAAEWNEERLGLVERLCRLVAVERDRHEAGCRPRFRAADEALAALERGAPADELEVLLRAAGCDLAAGPETGWKVLSVSAAGTDAETLRRVVDDALPGGTVAVRGATVVALLPHDGPSGRCTGERVRTLLGPLEDGLPEESWLAVGISHPVAAASALHGALDEADHALGLARASGRTRVRVAGPEEAASHITLLAALPDPVRRAFRDRLLGPLRAYDARHHADLLLTLEAFLACDGSWTRCAQRLNIHVNSVRYRIGRIEELTGRDLSRLSDRVDLLLALRIG